MAGKLHKLAALRLLSDALSKLEEERLERIERGDNPAEVDRETAQAALNGVAKFFLDHGIEAQPIVRLLSGLAALTAGSSRPAMFASTVTRHRRQDSPSVEGIKGRLAAIMEYRQKTGLTRKEAGVWVARNLPSKMKHQLRSRSPAAVDSWLTKWGGQYGTTGVGREGYLCMRSILAEQLTEQQLKKIIEQLASSLPS